jgi:hypothetical protein
MLSPVIALPAPKVGATSALSRLRRPPTRKPRTRAALLVIVAD